VAKGDVPGEWYAPTQPFPTKPPAFERQGVSIDDLIDFTPELRAEAVKLVSRYRIGPLFTPPVVSRWEGPLAFIMLPSNTGGPNWPGGALDPETNLLYIYSFTEPSAHGLVHDPSRSDMNYIRGTARPPGPTRPAAGTRAAGQPGGGEGGGGGLTVQGLPLIKPPWGRITAIDLNKGTIAWQIAHGETPDHVRNHPALKGLTIPRTGRGSGRIGTLVTKTLVIAGEHGFATTPSGQRGAMLRAYDKATGTEVGAVYLPAPQTGSPMTYLVSGRQHIALAVGGGNHPAELIAFRLPREQ
jgi:quinoprotein glucose dehydrogenase